MQLRREIWSTREASSMTTLSRSARLLPLPDTAHWGRVAISSPGSWWLRIAPSRPHASFHACDFVSKLWGMMALPARYADCVRHA